MFSPALLAYETLSAFRIAAHVLALLFVNLALRVYQLLRHLIIIIITLQVQGNNLASYFGSSLIK